MGQVLAFSVLLILFGLAIAIAKRRENYVKPRNPRQWDTPLDGNDWKDDNTLSPEKEWEEEATPERRDTRATPPANPPIDPTPDRPCFFGACWLAIRTEDPESAMVQLRLNESRPANWKSGLVFAAQSTDHVFVSPSVDGWVLVTGAIPTLDRGPNDGCISLLEYLGDTFKTVCFFGYHSMEYYAWARADDGHVVRAFAHDSFEVLCEFGATTSVEDHLDFFQDIDDDEDEVDDAYVQPIDEDAVLNVASEWAINPMVLDKMNLPASSGWVATAPTCWPSK
jgi:hypothetical protein